MAPYSQVVLKAGFTVLLYLYRITSSFVWGLGDGWGCGGEEVISPYTMIQSPRFTCQWRTVIVEDGMKEVGAMCLVSEGRGARHSEYVLPGPREILPVLHHHDDE